MLALPRAVQSGVARARALAFAGHLAFGRGDYMNAEDLLEQVVAAPLDQELLRSGPLTRGICG